MKSEIIILIGALFITSIIENVQLYKGYIKLENKLASIEIAKNNTNSRDYPVIIWNDDLEGIPVDGSLITLERTINDTIYIGAYDKTAKVN